MRLLLVLVVVLATAGPAQALPSARVSPLRTGFLDIAHRGASGLAPEHTIAAYDLALNPEGVLPLDDDTALEQIVRGTFVPMILRSR